MRTFTIQTLGCKVNQYESEQIATLLRSRGLVEVAEPSAADLRVVNTCSVTIQAASKSRQTTRRATRLPVLGGSDDDGSRDACYTTTTDHHRPRVIVTGCWATSDKARASQIPGVDAVLTHHDDVARELDLLLASWSGLETTKIPVPPESVRNDGWMIQKAGTPAGKHIDQSTPDRSDVVNGKIRVGTTSLPLLGDRQSTHQRAFLKVQDGCDAHCTYCIIPTLRPRLWSKPIDDVVHEAQRLVNAGHVEIVLSGIFLGAYGHETALRRRQPAGASPLGHLVEALCTRVRGLRRVRLSSLEPGDLNDELLSAFRSHEQVVPHFHLPLQSGSDHLLHRMNRQYTRDEFLRMIDRVNATFDRPAITTDIIVGFPGETDAEFDRTLEVVAAAKFIHIHAFSYSPRPGTAAARWQGEFVRGPVVNERIDVLRVRASAHGLSYRRSFIGQTVQLLVEQGEPRHGRCERYFDVHFDSPDARAGAFVEVRIDRITPTRTFGTLLREGPGMIAVVQRVIEARVRVGDRIVGEIGAGMAVLAAVHKTDTSDDITWTAQKLVALRIFRNADRHFDLDVRQTNGSILLVSNFTVAAATRQGRRPSLAAAADPATGRKLFDDFVNAVKALNVPVATGEFGADMRVEIVNDGPVTFIVDSRDPDVRC